MKVVDQEQYNIDYSNAFFFDASSKLCREKKETPEVPTGLNVQTVKKINHKSTVRVDLHWPFRRRAEQTYSQLQQDSKLGLERNPYMYYQFYLGIRPKIWKYLLKYMLINDAEQILLKKRGEYQQLLKNYWKPEQFTEDEKKIYHTINVDVKRIGSEYLLVCKSEVIQEMIKRLLFIWHNRHPASGYVQGMCDISMPFLIVFLS